MDKRLLAVCLTVLFAVSLLTVLTTVKANPPNVTPPGKEFNVGIFYLTAEGTATRMGAPGEGFKVSVEAFGSVGAPVVLPASKGFERGSVEYACVTVDGKDYEFEAGSFLAGKRFFLLICRTYGFKPLTEAGERNASKAMLPPFMVKLLLFGRFGGEEGEEGRRFTCTGILVAVKRGERSEAYRLKLKGSVVMEAAEEAPRPPEQTEVQRVEGALKVAVEKWRAPSGYELRVTVKNTGEEEVTFPNAVLGACVKRMVNGEWQDFHTPVSVQVKVKLKPGEERAVSIQLSNPPEGSYKVMVQGWVKPGQTVTGEADFTIP